MSRAFPVAPPSAPRVLRHALECSALRCEAGGVRPGCRHHGGPCQEGRGAGLTWQRASRGALLRCAWSRSKDEGLHTLAGEVGGVSERRWFVGVASDARLGNAVLLEPYKGGAVGLFQSSN